MKAYGTRRFYKYDGERRNVGKSFIWITPYGNAGNEVNI
jgi:hypothetical protein